MDFLNNINEKTIIVCPNNVKNKLLEVINNTDRLINVKFYSLESIKKLVLFDYDTNAILYLMNKYGYSYETAKNYIDNLYYIEDKKYSSKKLNFLVTLKNELISNNLLIFNNTFTKVYKNTSFIVFGYDYLTSFDKKILSNFNYKIINKDTFDSKINVYDFDTMEDELLFVVNKIIELVNNGIDLNKIYLLNMDSTYEKEIIKIFNMFRIPVDISVSSNVLSTIIGKKAFEYLKEHKSFEETLSYIESFDLDKSNNQVIYNTFLSIFNKYVLCDYSIELITELVKNDLESISIDNNELINMVRVGSLSNSYYLDSDYVFLLGFNQGVIPRIFKDEDYINDALKKDVMLDSVNVINKLEKEATISNLKAIKNLIVTYKRQYLDNVYYPSNMINDCFNVIKINDLSTEYSIDYSKIKLSIMLDNLLKYDKYDDELSKYYNSFDIRFMEYDNKFKGLEKEKLYNYLNNKLSLSYSTIDTFYKCQFRYYIEDILKLNKYEDTFYTLLGSLFHYVLSHVYDKDFDLNRYYDYYLKDKEITIKDSFYLDKLRKELRIICDRLLEFQHDTGLTSYFTEKNLAIDKSSNIEVVVKGIVDKIMYKEYDGKTLFSIIDYKTGSQEINLYNSVYGIGMQLIVYLYLITKSNLFNKYTCVGFYLQRILNGEVNIVPNKTYLEQKNENLRLYGYSTDDFLALSRFDPTYENSKYIRGMKITKKGFSQYANVISDEVMDKLIALVDKKITDARDLILKADFSINPKNIIGDKEIIGCKYCKYNDICNRKNEDIVNLKKYKDFSFLEVGDKDA